MTWSPTISGGVTDLVQPIPQQVNFREMAITLAQINRFTGRSSVPVSVGMHLLIGCDIAPEPLKPWWLLHDSHEERGGDISAPYKQAECAIARQMYGDQGAEIVRAVRREFERRHDVAIHQAAGLPLPSAEQKREIKRVDLIALATERRDFHATQSRRWDIDEFNVPAHSKVYRPMPAAKVADQLANLFTRYLPALSGTFGRVA